MKDIRSSVADTSTFDEAYYLAANPDVAAAVKDGMFASGWAHWKAYGQIEGRPGTASASRRPSMTRERRQKLLAGASKATPIIEIGPSHRPVAPKSDGWTSFSLDHATREELRAKYADHGVELNNIEEVDFVWKDGGIESAVPKSRRGSFEVLIASHVVEHVPCLVSFFKSCDALLSPTGKISLALPDRRYCFDYFRTLATTGDALAAFQRGATRHDGRTAFNHVAYSAFADGGSGAWGQHPVTQFTFAHTLDQAFNAIPTEAGNAGPYVDYHAWQFTPSSFHLVVLELAALGVIDWRIDRVEPATGCEFLVQLVRGRQSFSSQSELNQYRLKLLRSTMVELRTQTDYWIPR